MQVEQSSVMPPQSVVELDGVTARIILVDLDSATMTLDGEGGTQYEYRRYTLMRPHRDSIAEDVAENFSAWLEIAKLEDYANTAREVRERRDALLAKCDKVVAIDRLIKALPTISTTSFTNLLKAVNQSPWGIYRDTLRDLPTHPHFPYLSKEDWPAQPESEVITIEG